MRWESVISILAGLGLGLSTVVSGLRDINPYASRDRHETVQMHRVARQSKVQHKQEVKRAAGSVFLNANTTEFAVDGKKIPEVDFDVGESYAGSLPISDKGDSPSMFFWFWPTTNPAPKKEIIIWLNGGENGPFLWQPGTFKPYANLWSWHTLTNVIYVDQPLGTGFTQGNATATNDSDVAKQFMGFWRNFVNTFAIQGYAVYIAGESYGGQFVPYISDGFAAANDKAIYNISGALIFDPVLADDVIQRAVPMLAFTERESTPPSWSQEKRLDDELADNSGLFPFNDTFRSDLRARAQKCGFIDWQSQYLVFPAKQHAPDRLPGLNAEGDELLRECDLWVDVFYAISEINPCFDDYQIATTCPLLWDVLGFPGGANLYFDRADVKAAIHAPNKTWKECTDDPTYFNDTDTSLYSSVEVLPRVIDKTKNVIIAHGALDMNLLANGTLLAIQNMSFGNTIGFQSPPTAPFYVPYHIQDTSKATLAGAGVFGTVHSERGLTYVGVALAGHMVPQYAPSVAFRLVEFLLGRVDCLDCIKPFTVASQANVAQSNQSLGMGTFPQGFGMHAQSM